MGFVSSETLAEEVGLTHRATKKLILKFDMRGIPSGSSHMDTGKKQRMVLVDEDSFHNNLSGEVGSFRRKKKKTGKDKTDLKKNK
mgnify:FL=1